MSHDVPDAKVREKLSDTIREAVKSLNEALVNARDHKLYVDLVVERTAPDVSGYPVVMIRPQEFLPPDRPKSREIKPF